MTDKNEVLRSLYEITGNITDHNTVLVNIAELETLRTGYAAARLEIESLRGRGWVNLPGQLPEPGKPPTKEITNDRL